MSMERAEIARRLHLMVDDWLNSPLLVGDCHMLLRVSFRSRTDPDDAVMLVVGTENAEPDD